MIVLSCNISTCTLIFPPIYTLNEVKKFILRFTGTLTATTYSAADQSNY